MTTTRNTHTRGKSRIPSVEDVTSYAKEFSGLDFTPQYFHDFYQRTHWRIGGYKIQDWQAVFRVWARNSRPGRQAGEAGAPAMTYRQQCILSAETRHMEEAERQQQERERIYEEQRKAHVSYEEYLRMKGTPQPLHFGTSQKLGGDNTRRNLNDYSKIE